MFDMAIKTQKSVQLLSSRLAVLWFFSSFCCRRGHEYQDCIWNGLVDILMCMCRQIYIYMRRKELQMTVTIKWNLPSPLIAYISFMRCITTARCDTFRYISSFAQWVSLCVYCTPTSMYFKWVVYRYHPSISR